MSHKVNIFIAYAAADASLAAPLVQQLQELEAHHAYLSVTVQQGGSKGGAVEAVKQADMLILLVSRSFLQDSFYKKYLRNDPALSRGRKVYVLAVHPQVVANEPLLRLYSEELLSQPPLRDLARKGLLPDYYDDLVEGWLAPVWRRFRKKEEHAAAVQSARDREEAAVARRNVRLRAMLSAFAMVAVVLMLTTEPPNWGVSDGPGFVDRESADPGAEPSPSGISPPAQGLPEESPSVSPFVSRASVDTPPPSADSDLHLFRSSPSADAGPYERVHAVGEDRLVAFSKEEQGWMLLDAGRRPVTGQVYRRVYFQPGFVDGRMKVKVGEELFYIDRDGNRVQ